MPTTRANPIRLEIVGMHIPAFKNSKLMARNLKNGKLRPITDPELKGRMNQIIQCFVSQLLLNTQTIAPETCLGRSKLYVIASLLPGDDSWKWISDINIKAEFVPLGQEGCTIEITPIA